MIRTRFPAQRDALGRTPLGELAGLLDWMFRFPRGLKGHTGEGEADLVQMCLPEFLWVDELTAIR